MFKQHLRYCFLAGLLITLIPFISQSQIDTFPKIKSNDLSSQRLYLINSLTDDSRSFLDGPNCFNLSLKFSDVVSTLRFVDGHEFLFWLKSPLCRELKLTEQIQVGDIRAILQHPGDKEDYFPVHAEVFLNDNMIFEKMGLSKDHPYVVRTLPPAGRSKNNGALFSDAVRSTLCSRASGQPNECWSWVNIYRCESIKQYAENINRNINNKVYLDIETNLNKAESLLEDITLRRTTESHFYTLQVKNQLDQIAKNLNISTGDIPVVSKKMINEISKKLGLELEKDPFERLLIMNIAYRLRGIDFQLVNIRYPQADGRQPSPLIL